MQTLHTKFEKCSLQANTGSLPPNNGRSPRKQFSSRTFGSNRC